jgi:hypothetical protein
VTWSLYRWTWRLESPLYVGMPPAGSVNRCRLYVPARAIWGAVTAEFARAHAQSGFPEYEKVGKCLLEHVRFTYLFPAEREREDWRAWLPRYMRKEGLVWEREGAGDQRLPDRRFRIRLLSTRPSTAIEPSSDTAAEGSLRETECINTHWRDQDGRPGGPVALVGYVFLHNGLAADLRDKLKQLDAITVGGDTRYGLGQLRQIGKTQATSVFGYGIKLGNAHPEIEAERILGHADLSADALNDLRGEMELLRGWDYVNNHWCASKPLWVPGSAGEAPRVWRIDAVGHWALRMNCP